MPSRRYKHRLTKRGKWDRSKALECAARYLVKEGRPLTAATVYHNMRFKNNAKTGAIGNLYRSHRTAQTYGQVVARMRRCPAFKHSCDKTTYDEWWPTDPLRGEAYAKQARN
jgi:hypothetical protein